MDYVAQFHRSIFREVYRLLGLDADKATVEIITAVISLLLVLLVVLVFLEHLQVMLRRETYRVVFKHPNARNAAAFGEFSKEVTVDSQVCSDV